MDGEKNKSERAKAIVEKLWGSKSSIGLNVDEREWLEEFVIAYLKSGRFRSFALKDKSEYIKVQRLIDKHIIAKCGFTTPAICLSNLEQQEVESIVEEELFSLYQKRTDPDLIHGDHHFRHSTILDTNQSRIFSPTNEKPPFDSSRTHASGGSLIGNRSCGKYNKIMKHGGKVKEWITASSDKVAYPKLKTPDGKTWTLHSKSKTREEAEKSVGELRDGFYDDAKILDIHDGTNQKVYVYVTGKNEATGEPLCKITVMENGHRVVLNCFTEEEKKETFKEIKMRKLPIVDVKNKIASGGSMGEGGGVGTAICKTCIWWNEGRPTKNIISECDFIKTITGEKFEKTKKAFYVTADASDDSGLHYELMTGEDFGCVHHTAFDDKNKMEKGGRAGEKMITLYMFFGSYLQDGSLFAPFAIENTKWTTDKSAVEKIFNEAGLKSFKKEDLEEVKPLYRDGVLLFEMHEGKIPESDWKYRKNRAKEGGFDDENDYISAVMDYGYEMIKERAIFIDGEKVSKKELKEYFEGYEKGGAAMSLKSPDEIYWLITG